MKNLLIFYFLMSGICNATMIPIYPDTYTAGSKQLFNISSDNGNIGINTVTPGQSLDVQGTVRSTYFSGDGSALTNIPVQLKAYQGTTLRSGSFPIFKSATVSSGTAVFNLTNDATSTGTSLFPNGIINESINLLVSDATASYQMAYALTNSNKTLTVTANKLGTANILTGVLGQIQANGAVITLQIWGY